MSAWAKDVPRGEHERREEAELVAFVIDEGGQFGWSVHRKVEGFTTSFLRGGKAPDRERARELADQAVVLYGRLRDMLAEDEPPVGVIELCHEIDELGR